MNAHEKILRDNGLLSLYRQLREGVNASEATHGSRLSVARDVRGLRALSAQLHLGSSLPASRW
jgi:hypothetical protein